MDTISFDPIVLRIDMHAWSDIVELHVHFSNRSAPDDRLHAFLEVIALNNTVIN